MSSALFIIEGICSVRAQVNHAAEYFRTLRAVEALQPTTFQEQVVNGVLNNVASVIVTYTGKEAFT